MSKILESKKIDSVRTITMPNGNVWQRDLESINGEMIWNGLEIDMTIYTLTDFLVDTGLFTFSEACAWCHIGGNQGLVDALKALVESPAQPSD